MAKDRLQKQYSEYSITQLLARITEGGAITMDALLNDAREAMVTLRAPFPWFGGKRKVAALVWERFGHVDNYVEPFFGSGAVLLGRPTVEGVETVNDSDGYVANAWRAMKADPDAVAAWADHPVNENDLHARHIWLVHQQETLRSSLEGDPDWYEARIAGYWLWGMACWIGSGFCAGSGPWQLNEQRQLVHLGSTGHGVHRQRVHLGDAGRGVHRQRVHLGDAGQGVNRQRVDLLQAWFRALAARLRDVRIASGDWTRVSGPAVTTKHGMTAVFLDPPYADTACRTENLYRIDCDQVAHAVRTWALEAGRHPAMRIALCGYEGEHQMPETWACVAWNAGAGYGSIATGEGPKGQGRRERIWFSPACLGGTQPSLF